MDCKSQYIKKTACCSHQQTALKNRDERYTHLSNIILYQLTYIVKE
nr:MAG TPA: hypothetical protein [Caudoviricetes sp.]